VKVGPETDRCYPPLGAEVESDRIPELFGDIGQATEAAHLAYWAVLGEKNERPLRGFVASRGALLWRAALS